MIASGRTAKVVGCAIQIRTSALLRMDFVLLHVPLIGIVFRVVVCGRDVSPLFQGRKREHARKHRHTKRVLPIVGGVGIVIPQIAGIVCFVTPIPRLVCLGQVVAFLLVGLMRIVRKTAVRPVPFVGRVARHPNGDGVHLITNCHAPPVAQVTLIVREVRVEISELASITNAKSHGLSALRRVRNMRIVRFLRVVGFLSVLVVRVAFCVQHLAKPMEIVASLRVTKMRFASVHQGPRVGHVVLRTMGFVRLHASMISSARRQVVEASDIATRAPGNVLMLRRFVRLFARKMLIARSRPVGTASCFVSMDSVRICVQLVVAIMLTVVLCFAESGHFVF